MNWPVGCVSFAPPEFLVEQLDVQRGSAVFEGLLIL